MKRLLLLMLTALLCLWGMATYGETITVDVYADGYARIALGEQWYAARIAVQDGVTVALDPCRWG